MIHKKNIVFYSLVLLYIMLLKREWIPVGRCGSRLSFSYSDCESQLVTDQHASLTSILLILDDDDDDDDASVYQTERISLCINLHA
jgi:hypothetical protein